MIRPFASGAAALLAVAACSGAGGPPGAAPADLAAGLVRATDDTPPASPAGACWTREVMPAVIETRIEQVMIAPANAGASPRFRTKTRQQIVEDRRDVWLQTPCEAEMTPVFVATLQRALKARGFYTAPVSGEMDRATREAVRRFQAARGLDSGVLSVAAARDLGLIAVEG